MDYKNFSLVLVLVTKSEYSILEYILVLVLVNQNSVVLICDRTSTVSYNMFFKAILKF